MSSERNPSVLFRRCAEAERICNIMKYLVVIFAVIAMTVGHPERERRSVWGWPVVAPLAPAAAVIGPKAGPTAVIGPHAGGAVVAAPAVVAARVPGTAVITGPAGAIVAPGHPLVLGPHGW